MRPSDPFGTYPPSGFAGFLRKAFSHPPFNRGDLRRLLAPFTLGFARSQTMDITFRDARFRVCREGSPIDYGMLLRPAYNKEEIDFLGAVLSEGGVAVDVGSNIGMYTMTMAARVGETGTVLSIDASEVYFDRQRLNTRLNRFENIVIGENVAVGDRHGTVRLNTENCNPGTATVTEDDAGGIPMVPLLDLLEKHGIKRIDAFKIDIDGFEDKALTPFFRDAPDELLPRRFVLETILLPDQPEGFVQLMLDRGYVEVGRTRSNGLFELPARV